MHLPTVITLQTTQFLKYMICRQKVLFDSAHCVAENRCSSVLCSLPIRDSAFTQGRKRIKEDLCPVARPDRPRLLAVQAEHHQSSYRAAYETASAQSRLAA